MKRKKLELGKYYLIDTTWWFVNTLNEREIAKCVDIGDKDQYNPAFEFSKPVGHYNSATNGRPGYTLYIEEKYIKRKVSKQEAFIEAL
jgi:hypothetical protein